MVETIATSFRAIGTDDKKYNFLAAGEADFGFQIPPTWVPRFKTGVSAVASDYGVRAWINPGGAPYPETNSYSKKAGILGYAYRVPGVAGMSYVNAGVYGHTGYADPPQGLVAGVVGTAGGFVDTAKNKPGVIGYSRDGDGVQGLSWTGKALYGISMFGPAVYGFSGGAGPVVPAWPAAGVIGTSELMPGVIGTSHATAGVIGFSDNIGVYGESTNPASYAGWFNGNVVITGTIIMNPPIVMAKFPGGTQHLLHCMESPEHWLEDFGAARLKSGRATVKLDGDFAKVTKRGDYHVFLTAKGDCGGLYVRRQGGASFEVREFGGGKSSVAFSYRIVGRRKDVKPHGRFAKVDIRPPAPPKPRPPRKPTAAALRTFVARLDRETLARTHKRAR